MEGLEITEILLSKALYLNDTFRIDAEYFSKYYLMLLKKLNQLSLDYIETNCFVTDGIHESIDFDEASSINLISAKSPKKNYFDLSGNGYISKAQHNANPRTALQNNDIIISTVGTIGNVAVVDESILPANSDRHVGIIRINNQKLRPYYLSTFLLSKYGYFQSIRESTGNVQLNLFIYRIKKILVFNASNSFQEHVERVCIIAKQNSEQAIKLYQQAEALLLKELGLANFKPIEQAVNIKLFKESFASTGRLDAEYYQPKYESTIHKIKSSNYKKLIQLVSIKKSIEPGSEVYDTTEGIPFIRVSDYSKMGITDPAVKLNLNYYHSNQEELNKLFPKKDTILFSKDGSIGIAYQVKEDLKAITSGAILHLNILDNIEDILPEYLTLVLNSFMVQMQAERDAGGSIINHWRIDQIEDVIIPIIPNSIQQQITELIQQSFTLKAQSEHLLEVAKQAVEIAIEQSEAAALDFINRECGDA